MKSEAFNMLRTRGVTKAVVTFSGGNDEGDIEQIVLHIAGEQINLEPHYYGDEATPDRKLAELLEQPVWDRYGGFAGDYQVYGTVTWDVTTNKVIMSKSESQYVDQEFEL